MTVDEHQVARLLAAGRLTIGVALLVAPGLTARVWVGAGTPTPEVKALARAAGIRDLVLGAGVLRALTRGSGSQAWVAGAATCDAVDAVTALAGARAHPGRALLMAMVAGGSAAAGATAARELSED